MPVRFPYLLVVLGVPGCLAPLDSTEASSEGIGEVGSADDANTDDAANDGSAGADESMPEGGGDDTSGPPPEHPPSAPGGYYIVGNTVYDEDDAPHLFRGVARPSLEWSATGEGLSEADYANMASWGANVVRIALNQGFWLAGSVVHDASYPAVIDQQIGWAHAAGLDVILDLHWSDRGDFAVSPDQQRMADAHSVLFWQEVAARYEGDGRVLFELYNEPHDVPWDVWRDGGDSGDGFAAVGMQALYDAVRDAGADNVVIVGGLDWAYDLSGVPGANEIDGYNVMYASHPYDYPNKAPALWDADWGFMANDHPVIVTEFGSFDCNTSYSAELVEYAAAHDVSWTAWAWYPGGCEFPALIEDWNGTPSAAGQIIRDAF